MDRESNMGWGQGQRWLLESRGLFVKTQSFLPSSILAPGLLEMACPAGFTVADSSLRPALLPEVSAGATQVGPGKTPLSQNTVVL